MALVVTKVAPPSSFRNKFVIVWGSDLTPSIFRIWCPPHRHLLRHSETFRTSHTHSLSLFTSEYSFESVTLLNDSMIRPLTHDDNIGSASPSSITILPFLDLLNCFHLYSPQPELLLPRHHHLTHYLSPWHLAETVASPEN